MAGKSRKQTRATPKRSATARKKPARTKVDRSYSTRDTNKRKEEFKGAPGMFTEMAIERKQRDAARRAPQSTPDNRYRQFLEREAAKKAKARKR